MNSENRENMNSLNMHILTTSSNGENGMKTT